METKAERTPWHERWDEGLTPWDLKGPHPLFEALLWELRHFAAWSNLKHWHVSGCGHAHDAAELARRGAVVTAIDLVPAAIEAAKKLYGDMPSLTLKAENALEVPSTECGVYDGIFDRAMLCALSGENRTAYVRACHQRLRVGGYFISIAFGKVAEPGPKAPFEMAEADLRKEFGQGWQIDLIMPRLDGPIDNKILSEWLFIAKKI